MRSHHHRVCVLLRLPLCSVSILMLMGSLSAHPTYGQSTAKSATTAAPKTDATTPPVQPISTVLGDYVPCLFEESEEYSLRSLPYVESLVTQNQADQLRKALSSGSYGTGVAKLDTDSLIGKTPTQAVESSMNLISSSGPDTNKEAAAGLVKNILSGKPPVAPNDVSCSFNFMQWQETSDTFGRRVANQYVALQVNVRNLNSTSEFLIHDIQVAVDSLAPSSYFKEKNFARFQTTRNKLIVRAVAQRGQTEDPRNRILNILTMLGGIGGGVNAALQAADAGTALATNYSTGVAIFQGSFLPGFTNIFPDHTLEHINHINDLAFSASSNSKTIVSVKGSVPLTTFISEKPLEQMPFAGCGKKLSRKSPSADPGNASYYFCEGDDPANAPKDYRYFTPISYHHWAPAALKILGSRTYVVIGGVHINESPTTAALAQLQCPSFSDGTVDLSKIANSVFMCSATGTHLEKIATVNLKATGNAAAKPISGTVAAGSDGTGATVQFTASDLNNAAGQYSISLLDSAGAASQTSLILSFPSPPREPTISMAPLFTGTTHNANSGLTLTGTNLDRIGTLTITPSGGTAVTLPAGKLTVLSTAVETINHSLTITILAASIPTAGTYTLAGTAADGTAITFSNGTTIKVP